MLGLKDLFPSQGPKQNPHAAPYFEAPPQKIIAVEHPYIIKDVDKAVKTFGTNPNLQRLFEDDTGRVSLPLWLRPQVPTTKPIMSHNAASNNVVLKITVPKRTGRKRKRGSDEPFSGDFAWSDAASSEPVCSFARLDDPTSTLRKLQDNIGKYQAEAVGYVKDTHRYRGLADFQFSGKDYPYLTKVADHLLPMKVSKLKELRIDPSLHTGKGQEIIPPPYFTDRTIPFNYLYEQNPYVREQGKDEHGNPIVINVQSRLALTFGHYINHDQYPIPVGPTKNVMNSRQVPPDLLERMRAAMNERPIWTRRALITRVAPYYSDNSLKIAVQLVGYQFKGGPWRDAVIKYGVDPRTSPEYRIYQTLAFKLEQLPINSIVKNGVVRSMGKEETRRSYFWDGQSYCTNGKFWQICDITDPELVKMIEAAPLRTECDINSEGWWYTGTWSKVKAFMKAKMIAIKAGRLGSEDDEPKKKDCLYDSIMLEKLSQYPDINPPNSRTPVNVNVLALLYGMEDVAGLEGIRYRYRRRQDFKDQLAAMGFRRRSRKNAVGEQRPEDHGLGVGPGSESDDGSEGGEERKDKTQFPDDAWAHILDSDLSGGEGGDADESIMPEDDEGQEDDDMEAGEGEDEDPEARARQ
ncbi:hypothetical protein JX265_008557 [Neoarthrinium moseri]|uniref:Transcription factor tau subunit sfc1 n=1 Tax=Neoarthrinium moseri TaxID=1658444 RepID=A0A9P9WHI8_9PEZI|nr:uncharacterized protein JN550_011034 [Neoarthrinium moseri]KAI1849403.1 hypothetical protein JX266_004898 [Neoarthrinium moseri]KAI1861212.1 hypothetical protein JN550_011034 [Neoarthrinium moseri]KAI1864186.1 hypothetical protein JX265_008557 [Neoarthrinium moseri]